MNTKLQERREFIKLASGLLVTPFASLAGGSVFAADDKPPLRMLTVIDSYGVPIATRNEIWVKSTASDYALSDDDLGTILSPLKAYKDNMLIASGINLDSLSQTGNSRTHHFMATHTLAASRNVSGSGATSKIEHASIDVHVGQYLNNDYGLSRAYPHLFFSTVSQSNDTTYCYDESGNQVRSIAGPKKQATSIFADVDNIADLQFQNKTQQSVFDLVQKQVQALRGQLKNANAATVMDAYQSSVDDLAAQIQLSSSNVCGVPGGIDTYPDAVTQSTVSTPYVFKNIYQAFACNLTSSLTFAIGGEKINQLKHADLYDEEEHASSAVKSLLAKNMHSISHQVTDEANKAHEVIRIHQSEELATLLDNMSNTTDIDGSTLLDNTVIFWTSAMSHNTHQKTDYPYLLIAGKNTNLKGGFHYDCSGSTNNDLLTTIAQGMGLPDDRFGGHNKNGIYLGALQNGPISRMLKS